MGLMDRRAALLEDKAAEKEARSEARGEVTGQRYVTEVNRGSVNMTAYQERLNTMWHKGYRLHTAFEQDGNTVTIFERRD